MHSITIKSFNEETTFKRILYKKKVHEKVPSIIILAGMHGNEFAGIFGLKRVIDQIKDNNLQLKGNFYALAGNLNALQKNIRYEKEDLNRLWTKENIASLTSINNSSNPEIKEQLELYQIIKEILSNDKGPFYFIDLHTTSAETIPFITISDSLNNRRFASHFALPTILGIEEYLEGPLLTYINEFGHISLGFEAGRHEDIKSIENCEAFIWLTLQITSCINKSEIKNYKHYKQLLSKYNQYDNFFEIDDLYRLKEQDDFMMVKDFKNFEFIERQQIVAVSNNQEVKARINGQIFMPLYQNQGREGFFIITKITKFWLQLSAIARKLKFHNLLRVLPGIQKDNDNKHTLIVNPRIAKFLAVEIFHLFGYRKKVKKGNKLYFIKRDRDIIDFY